MTRNITITGAASLVFSMSIINDLTRKTNLGPGRLVLMDPNQEGLELVASLARRLGMSRGLPMDVRTTSSLEGALDGADFVINAAAIGERSLWPGERAIAREHGYWPSKGFRLSGLRNTPLTLRIARAMEQYCPNAWLLQHSNPMAGNVGAVSRYTSIKVAGFCHGVENTIGDLASWMGIDRARIDAEAVGMNHFLFFSKWYVDGRDSMEELMQWSEKEFPKVWESPEWRGRTDIPGPISQNLARVLGAFPCNGDEHLSDYFRWYTSTEAARLQFRAKIDYLDRYLARGESRLDAWGQLAHTGDDEQLEAAFRAPSTEAAADVVEALALPNKSLALHVILPNHGCVEGLPWESCVEVPALVTPDAIRPIGRQHMPGGTGPHIALRMAEEELEMQAGLEQSRQLLRQSLQLDPYTETLEQVDSYIASLADFDREHLTWLS